MIRTDILKCVFLALISMAFISSVGWTQTESLGKKDLKMVRDMEKQTMKLESRVRELEDFVDTIHSNLTESVEELRIDTQRYKRGIENSLEDYSRQLNSSIDERMRQLDDEVVVLNLASKGYNKIETNSGAFLLSIRKVERIQGGYRLNVHVGNPNFASYSGVKFYLNWGKKWAPDGAVSYDDWRRSLIGAEYTYDGSIEPGSWTQVFFGCVTSNHQRSQIHRMPHGC